MRRKRDKPAKKPGPPASVYTAEVLAAIPVYRDMGLRLPQIAEILGTTRGSLEQMCIRERISMRQKSERSLEHLLTARQWKGLLAEADRRGVPVMQLVIALIGIIVDDDMFDAVLDDTDEWQESPPCSAPS